MLKNPLLRWLPALLIMLVIFAASSTPSSEMPRFGLLDTLVKKGAHMFGYGLLALSYWYALRFEKRFCWLAWLLAVFYAMTDEFHQSFVPGRHSSWIDVFLFDGGGAALLLALAYGWQVMKLRLHRI